MSSVATNQDSIAAADDQGVANRAVTAVASRLVIIVPYLWLLVFFLIPFFIVFKIFVIF